MISTEYKMEQLLAPVPLKDGNLAEGWKRFKREFSQFMIATGKDKSSKAVRVAILLRTIGPRGNDIYENFGLSETDKVDYDKVIEAYDAFCKPQDETFIARHRLLNMKQDGLPIEEFETKLRTQARLCNFDALTDDLTCHALVQGLDDIQLRDKLLLEACKAPLTLTLAVKMARESAVASTHMKELGGTPSEPVHKLYERRDPPPRKVKETESNGTECDFCGTRHKRGASNCPAYGATCRYCQKKNHFERSCRKKKADNSKPEVQALTASYDSRVYEELLVLNQPTVSKIGKRLLVTLTTNNKKMEYQLDTAAARNVMTYHDFRRLGETKLEPSHVVLTTYDGGEMPSSGKAFIKFEEMQDPIEFEIIKTDNRPYPLIGVDTCLKAEMIKVGETVHSVQTKEKVTREWLTQNYDDIFKGLGLMPGEYEIKIDKSVPPVQHRPRRTPIMMKDDVIKKLRDLEKAGVVSKVDEPTEWISSQVALRKPNGTIRLCIDPKDLNRAIIRNHYPIPTLEDVLPQLSRAKCFSLLDAKDGFFQVKLAEGSRKLTTFWTPLGRYCWNRLPFGLSSSGEEYQRRLHMVLDGLEGVEVIADDILVYGVGESETEARADHDRKLLELMERIREKGVKINKEKMKLHLTEIKYMGHLLTTEGIKPDPAKVQGLKDMPEPSDTSEVKRFLGTANYLAKFVPHLSSLAEELRDVTQDIDDDNFTFGEQQKKAFEALKDAISEDTLLRYYDPNKPAIIECDASTKGLGAMLTQEGKPISFSSRTLTDTEEKYHPMELECLAVIFACSKFDQYIYGKTDLQIFSDHRPLESIFKKEMEKSPLRLQKMLLSLQRYGFNLEYRPGKEQVVADMLSRAPVKEANPTADQHKTKVEVFLADMDDDEPTQFTDMSDERLERIKAFGEEDETYKTLRRMIVHGWPEKRSRCEHSVKDYWTFRDELAERDGLIYKGKRLVIPTNMIKEVAQALHGAHQSAETMLRRARDIIYWPDMQEHLQNTASLCKPCQLNKPANRKEPLLPHEVPDQQFSKVGTDVMYYRGSPYLILVDYMSDFIEVTRLRDEAASTVVEACKEIFARHGIPHILHSDNAPYYASSTFRDFAADWRFTHTTSSPYHSQSNGKAEADRKSVV